MSYPGNDVVVIVARLLFGISIITIYPIVLFLGRSVLQDFCLGSKQGCIQMENSEKCMRILMTTAWVVVTLIIALCVPDISEVVLPNYLGDHHCPLWSFHLWTKYSIGHHGNIAQTLAKVISKGDVASTKHSQLDYWEAMLSALDRCSKISV
ncbi:hypothetical protein Chor_013206 [Crotalus horridus]